MTQQNQTINNHAGYLNYLINLATKLEMILYEVHTYVHEFGSETTPYFRIMWVSDQQAPMISMHVETQNTDAIQYYAEAKTLCSNLLLGENYYTSFEGETFVGNDAAVAVQMDREVQMTETTTQAMVSEEPNLPILIINTPIYHAQDPRAKEQIEALKRRRGFGRFNG